MIDPNYLIVLVEGAEVYVSGYGLMEASRIPVKEYFSERWFPDEENPRTYPAIKGHAGEDDVWIRQSDVNYIVDLTDHEFVPVTDDDKVPAVQE